MGDAFHANNINWGNTTMSKIALTALAVLSIFGAAVAAEPSEGKVTVTRLGSQAAVAGPEANFSGSVKVESVFKAALPSRVGGAIVSFSPGARTAWHTHPLGQTLVVTSGAGHVQQWGGPIHDIRQGDIVSIPPGAKHWHGAGPGTGLSHAAMSEALDGKTVAWMEKVSPLPASAATPAAATPAQRMYGEIAPKLAELTDKVLYADVWERSALSKRDRSLVTVSALIAMNRPDQLRSHLRIARENGVTETELVEAITHLAFYAGWPNAVTAIAIAKDVFAQALTTSKENLK